MAHIQSQTTRATCSGYARSIAHISETQQWAAGGSTGSAMVNVLPPPLCPTAPSNMQGCVCQHFPRGYHLFSAPPKEMGLSSTFSHPKELSTLTGHFPSAQLLCLLLCYCHQLLHPYSSKQTRTIQPRLQASTISLLCPPSSEPKGWADSPSNLFRKAICPSEIQSVLGKGPLSLWEKS